MESVAKFVHLVAVVRACSTVHSRLKLHKIFYILRSLGFPVPWAYEFRDYGPYSTELAADLRSAINAAYVHEVAIEVARDEDEEPYRRYDMSALPRGEDLLASEIAGNPALGDIVESMAGIVAELAAGQPLGLELQGALMFLQDEHVRPDLVTQVLRSVKPQFTETEVRASLEAIADLRSRRSFRPVPSLSGLIGIVAEGPPSDAAGDLDETLYDGK